MNQDMHHSIHERLDDFLDAWLDGELAGEERLEFEAHVDQCPECRDKVAAAEQLRAMTDALPDEIEPPRDLWPDIASRLEPRPEPGSTSPATTASGHPVPWFRAAAAVAILGLVFFGGMLADRVMQEGLPGSGESGIMATTDPAGDAASPRDLATAHVTSAQARRELPDRYVRLVSNSSASSETRDTMLQNLLIVNLAIREVEAALEDDPNDSHLRDMLRSLYAQENQILNRVERMVSTHQDNVRTGI